MFDEEKIIIALAVVVAVFIALLVVDIFVPTYGFSPR